jgi:hypothetical protein
MARERVSSGGPDPTPEGWDKLHVWISKEFQNKTTPRKIIEWHNWAFKKLKTGWTPQAVRDHMMRAWHTHTLTHDMEPLQEELRDTLNEVFLAASSGWTPAQCAVVYRSLFRVHPTRHWLVDWAERWEAAGDDWKAVVMP